MVRLIEERNGGIVYRNRDGREIFNTATPMPAILGTIEVGASIEFPRAPGETVTVRYIPISGSFGFLTKYSRRLPASELVYEHVLGNAPIGMDFLLVNFKVNSVSRTSGGLSPVYSAYEADSKWYVANGSVLMERHYDGAMIRAMSFLIDGSEIKCQLQQTNRAYSISSSDTYQDYVESTYNMTFKISYGKFVGL